MKTDDELTDEDLGIDEGCGYEYDHKLRKIDESEEGDVYECLECGAEIIE